MLSVKAVALILVAASLLAPSALARPKTDVVVLDNGNQVNCEIKKLQRGKVTIKTDAFGTISVKWSRVTGFSSEYHYQVELDSGVRYLGKITLGDRSATVKIGEDATGILLDVPRIVAMIPVESSFFSRLSGSVDAGYNFTQATTATAWSSSAQTQYRTPRLEADLNFSSNVQQQTGAETTNRQNLQLLLTRFYQNRWFAAILGQAEKSANQGLDLRGLVGGGAGKRLIQTNRSNVSVLGGAAFSREKYEDSTDYDSNAELVAALVAETYRFDSPELDLSAGFALYPNLTTAGRYRIQVNGKAKIEIVKNLYWSMTLYESFDSDPPSADARRNDFGLTTSLGWSFN